MKLAIVLLLIGSIGGCFLQYFRLRDSIRDYKYKKNWLEKHFATPSDEAARALFNQCLASVCWLLVALFSISLIFNF